MEETFFNGFNLFVQNTALSFLQVFLILYNVAPMNSCQSSNNNHMNYYGERKNTTTSQQESLHESGSKRILAWTI